ncbi:MAG: TIGR00730 family Rossman fold protein [Deltaproteobacteria bacterium]|nr:TIGR00730 family Rossman fold protein [Deltaproteobacteria bacterium]
MKRLCVFCGASAGLSPVYIEMARTTGRVLAEQGIELVYGGGKVGLMGALADAALSARGKVIGVIPQAMCAVELDHKGLTEQHIVESMHERKALMAELADGFIALPGGIGTLEEFFEVWTWAQLGIHAKPCGLLNVHHYYDLLLNFLDQQVVANGFVEAKSRSMVMVADNILTLVEKFRAFQPTDIRRALTMKQS